MSRHSYAAAERFILSREFFGMKLGLENITAFLESIGSPQYGYKTIHIAGTNGKGSTAAMLAAIFQAQGYKTGLFTSPHLVSLRERVRVNGRTIPRSSVASFVDRHRKALSKRKLSFFEVITAMALEYFARAGVDIAVIETGLGGRLDASNVLSPLMTITTDISRDHLEILGTTIAKIAREKAGIVKESVPHLVGLLPESAEAVIRKRCLRVGAPFFKLSRGNFRTDSAAMRLNFKYNGLELRNIAPSLLGTHQLRNTALVLKAISILRERGLVVSKKAIRDGISNTIWRGRFQVIHYRRKPTHVFDVCHNASGLESFAETFQLVFPGRRAKVITGFVKRKEHQKMFDSLSRIADSYALVPLKSGRSTNLDELVGSINWRGIPFKKYGSLKTAYSKTLGNSDPEDVVVIVGSHFLVGEFFEKYRVR
ncbi:MAG: bifunctional folylpolyglutamate synthase/dihydrofolate synthase [Candidatus Zixiibacteriota bacterium]|nr:MAG: bifunctional folylpolyglutamate synthase/dihydrofolate synthase [candidate division Zixibacteria bacterium]